jgi:hypothetical protein
MIHLSTIREIRDDSSLACEPRPTGNGLAREASAIISSAAVGGDNALSDRVTPRNFRKTRKSMMQPKPGALGL